MITKIALFPFRAIKVYWDFCYNVGAQAALKYYELTEEEE